MGEKEERVEQVRKRDSEGRSEGQEGFILSPLFPGTLRRLDIHGLAALVLQTVTVNT